MMKRLFLLLVVLLLLGSSVSAQDSPLFTLYGDQAVVSYGKPERLGQCLYRPRCGLLLQWQISPVPQRLSAAGRHLCKSPT